MKVSSAKVSPGKRRTSKRSETKVFGKTVMDRKISTCGEFSTSYTSQNPWTTLRSPINTRFRYQNPLIRIFWCLRVPTTFMYENIILRFGCPKILVSDSGSHFLNELFEEMTTKFRINHRKTTPYYPQTNGQTERVNGILVSILQKTVLDSKRNWDVKLMAALWAYRITFKATTRATPFSLVFGIEVTLPIEFKVEALRVAVSSRLPVKQSLRNRLTELEELDEKRRVAAQHIEAIQRRRKIIFDKRNKRRALEPCMMVMILDARKMDFPGKFDVLWLGP